MSMDGYAYHHSSFNGLLGETDVWSRSIELVSFEPK